MNELASTVQSGVVRLLLAAADAIEDNPKITTKAEAVAHLRRMASRASNLEVQ